MTSEYEMNDSNVIGDALKVLANSLSPFVIDEMKRAVADRRYNFPQSDFVRLRDRDIQFVLQTIRRTWNEVFADGFPWDERDRVRNLIHESLDIRNRWAYQRQFDLGERFRALDTIERLLIAIGDKSAARHIRRAKRELLPPQPTPPHQPPAPLQHDPPEPTTPVSHRPAGPIRSRQQSTYRPQLMIQSLMRTLLEDYPTLLDQADIQSLFDPAYCKNELGLRISGFALLRTREHGSMESGHSRYYAHEYAGKYLLCSQWWKDHHCHNAEVLTAFVQS